LKFFAPDSSSLLIGRCRFILAGMKFRVSYFAKPSTPGAAPALLAAHTGDFNTVDDARKAAVADADEIHAADSIIIDPIGERWVKSERLVKTDSRWERVPEPER
jgi:hypothetical protein